jgi:hypothetical protein
MKKEKAVADINAKSRNWELRQIMKKRASNSLA